MRRCVLMAAALLLSITFATSEAQAWGNKRRSFYVPTYPYGAAPVVGYYTPPIVAPPSYIYWTQPYPYGVAPVYPYYVGPNGFIYSFNPPVYQYVY
ncbi:hypothetical protein Pan216_44730 [Planctomycetes bacterium Pan216]|uniref:Uncharacterized protein n=1 Tax=Kolteria novifilia TaxID=2527975 RepID=A0A518B9E3_9BACT|nr:hypothetical protein Pan216_44730 [Planctomycetes bacterium Pan216]